MQKLENIEEESENSSDTTENSELFVSVQKSNSDLESDCEMDKDDWNYNPKKEEWEVYIELLELFFETKDIEEEKKVPHLLTNVGMEMYKRMRDLCAPAKPKEKI